MTGYRSKFFRHNCDDRQACYVESLPLWDDLIECFPRNIRPTDIDGMVEINNHFLFLEEKSAGKHIEEGQRRALQNLAARQDVTVILFRPGAKSDLEVLMFPEPNGWEPRSRDEFKTWLRDWAASVDVPAVAS